MKRLLISCLICVLTGCPKEATFQGRPTSYWIQELKSPWSTARMRAANALSNLGTDGQRAIPDIIPLLEDRDPLVRWSAASALGMFGSASSEALPTLRKMAIEDPEARVRFAAEEAVRLISTGTLAEQAPGGS